MHTDHQLDYEQRGKATPEGLSLFTGTVNWPALPGPLSHLGLVSRLASPSLFLILVVAALLRFNGITQPFTDAFSWRQVSVAMMAENFYRTDWNIFYPEVNWSGPGPNYQGREFQTVSYLAALLYTFLGQQDWIGRTIAICFGVWGIFALYQLTRRVWSENVALAGAAVMAVLPGSIAVERSFLPDPAMTALVVTSFWLLVVYLQTGRERYLLLAGFIGAWGFCTKITGLIVGLPMAYTIVAILSYRLLRPRTLGALALFGLMTLAPVAAYYLWARHLALSYPPYHFAGDGNWVWQNGLGNWLAKDYFLPRLFQRYREWLWTTPMIALVGWGLLLRPPTEPVSQKEEPTGKPVPWLFHIWLLAGAIYYFIGAEELVENPWNFHILDPAAAVLAGHAILALASGVSRLIRQPVAPLVTIALLAAIGWAGYRGLQSIYYPYAGEGYRLGLAMREITQPGELVVTVGTNFGDPVPIYYAQRRGWGFPPADPGYAWDELPEDDAQAIAWLESLRARGAIWLGIVPRHQELIWQEHPDLARHIERTGKLWQHGPEGPIYRLLSPAEVAALPPAAPEESGLTFEVDPATLITQEIRYTNPDAGEVFLVWGVEGWYNLPEAVWPAGTKLKKDVMYTPMAQVEEGFTVELQVPAEITLDYGFLVTLDRGGQEVNWWEANGDTDFHTVATGETPVEVQTGLIAAPVASAPAVRLPLWLGLGLVLALGVVTLRRTPITWPGFSQGLHSRQGLYLRDLVVELVVRDLKLRYKRSVLGIAWSLLNPLAQLLIFTFLFHKVLPLNIPHYPLFVFTGVLVWNWFQSSLFLATGAITDNRELVRRPGFPAAILPIITVMSNLVHFLLALPILLIVILVSDLMLDGEVLLLPVIVALQFILTLSLAYLVATFHVTFRDTQHLLGVLLMLLFYLTPVFYDAGVVPAQYTWLYLLNPMVHLLAAYRAILLEATLPGLDSLVWLGLLGVGLLSFSYTLFVRASTRFVEEL